MAKNGHDILNDLIFNFSTRDSLHELKWILTYVRHKGNGCQLRELVLKLV